MRAENARLGLETTMRTGLTARSAIEPDQDRGPVSGTRPALTGDAWKKASSLTQERGAVDGARRQFAPDQLKGGQRHHFFSFSNVSRSFSLRLLFSSSCA